MEIKMIAREGQRDPQEAHAGKKPDPVALDEKGLLAAERGYMEGTTHYDSVVVRSRLEAAIRAYLEAASSPSPAPGVVEKWAADREMLAEAAADTSLSDGAVRALCLAKVGEVTQEVRDWAALASLSQPAKGEREGEQP